MLLLWIHLRRPAGLVNFAYEHSYFYTSEMESITFVLCICSVQLYLILDILVLHIVCDINFLIVKCQSLNDNI